MNQVLDALALFALALARSVDWARARRCENPGSGVLDCTLSWANRPITGWVHIAQCWLVQVYACLEIRSFIASYEKGQTSGRHFLIGGGRFEFPHRRRLTWKAVRGRLEKANRAKAWFVQSSHLFSYLKINKLYQKEAWARDWWNFKVMWLVESPPWGWGFSGWAEQWQCEPQQHAPRNPMK